MGKDRLHSTIGITGNNQDSLSGAVSIIPSMLHPSSALVMEFLAKIGQVLLRERITTGAVNSNAIRDKNTSIHSSSITSESTQQQSTATLKTLELEQGFVAPSHVQTLRHTRTVSAQTLLDLHALNEHVEFWRSGMPVYVDIVDICSSVLLERWIISFESAGATTNGHSHNGHQNETRNGYPADNTLDGNIHISGHKPDPTNLILLVQSLYLQVRLLPLGAALADTSMLKSDLSYCMFLVDGQQVSPLGNMGEPLSVPSMGFHPTAKLKVHRLRSAQTTHGSLHLSVVYDHAFADTIPTVRPPPQTKAFQQQSDSNRSKSMPDSNVAGSNPTPTDTPLSASSHIPKIINTSNLNADIGPNGSLQTLTNLRSFTGSPFPSPTMQKRVLDIANLKLLLDEPPSSTLDGSSVGDVSTISQLSAKQTSTPADSKLSLSNQLGTPTKSSLQLLKADIGSIKLRLPPHAPLSALPVMRSSLGQSMLLRTNSASSDDSAEDLIQNHVNTPSPLNTDSSTVGCATTTSTKDKKTPPLISVLISNPALDTCKETFFDAAPIHRPIPLVAQSIHTSTPMRVGLTENTTSHPFHHHSTTPLDLFGSLVGSYEESILSGRMSTLPSRPITFLAEIGVIGIGKCKQSLKCPPHLTLAFPAYFYELLEEESPATPYVGNIDVEWRLAVREDADGNVVYVKDENNVSPITVSPRRSDPLLRRYGCDITSRWGLDANRRRQSLTMTAASLRCETKTNSTQSDVPHETIWPTLPGPGLISSGDSPVSISNASTVQLSRTKQPDHSGYRLPFKGQLQVVIKNPSRTAVKVFLVPYDLRDMPAGSKTFMRQKSYALLPARSPFKNTGAGKEGREVPAFNSSQSSNAEFPSFEATAKPCQQQSTRQSSRANIHTPTSDRLRYAMHLQFVCTEKRRLYLCKSIRVVFSHRAPDSDECLRSVCEGPSKPKYMRLDGGPIVATGGDGGNFSEEESNRLDLLNKKKDNNVGSDGKCMMR
ncbi:hypothetical protein BATDEDRAFT_88597 [Batrachochytrium dendrobatidis JAM81]|uniref:Atos-like conserved domain-containing protein n=1 Tax=Batrachochytrium dendrobatidis (strain JAM81 / FGSC 10211) TaxID=684364 RepID=F4P3E4_BATDJ|nr:uncharacterized protein BATDEDRAFT_88597 [Batrachochytrium dendrobatidis JAM81]EGF80175.1 hypothetical protein BATDEDRAFT_88597 [Batrachochytrium dendrobatidis JAM81]KAK5666726.1 hypothetical protein QVD99_006788 [Batrachochytrium dendrobatidis]|eukprot:XP_006679199.1 hypothetical protein BATDEDRAFT_88597 [Batrachochytrium dendrobatidis JAM81]